MMMKEYAEDKLLQFLQGTVEPFYLIGLLRYLGESTSPSSCDDLADYLVFNQLAYAETAADESEETWVSRAGLFTGKSVAVKPANFEIAAGILIPGSRLVPFANSTLLPHELTFTCDGKKLEPVRVDVTPDEAYPLYSLFGEEYVPQFLSLDNEENAAIFAADDYCEPLSFPLTAVNLRDVYWGASFAAGDCLMARCVDWKKGVFDLSVRHESDVDSAVRGRWMSALEDALVSSFPTNGPCASIDEQLSFAFFLAQEDLFVKDAGTVMEFMKWTKKVSPEYYGVETRLWYAEGEIPSQKQWNLVMIDAPSTLFDDSLVHMGLPLSSAVVDSYVLDALFRKETGPDALLERLIPVRHPSAPFCVPVIARSVQQRFKAAASSYNWFADHEKAVLRNRYVALHEGIARFLFSLSSSRIGPDLIPDQGSVILGQLLTHAVTALENLDNPKAKAGFEAESLWESIEGVEENFFDVKTDIQEVLPELMKRRFSVIRKREGQA